MGDKALSQENTGKNGAVKEKGIFRWNAADIALAIVGILVIISVIVYAFTWGNIETNSDMASALLRARETIRSGEFIPSSWNYSSDLIVYGPHVFMIPLFLFMDNWMLIRSAAIMCYVLTAVLSCIFLSRKVFKNNMFLVAIPLLFCCISDEYRVIVFGDWYGGIMTMMFLLPTVYLLSIDEKFKVRSKPLFALFLILTIFVGLDGVRFIQAVDVPLVAASVLYFYINNVTGNVGDTLKKAVPLIITVVLTGLAMVAGYVGFQLLIRQVSSFPAGSEPAYWDTLDSMYLVETAKYFIGLFGLTWGVPFFSVTGIVNLVKIFGGVMLLIVFPILQIKKYKTENFGTQIFILFSLVHICEIMILSVFTRSNEGTYINGFYRYMFSTMFLLLILSSHYIYKYVIMPFGSLTKSVVVFTAAVYTLTSAAPNFLNVRGYQDVLSEKNALADHLVEKGLDFGYATYWNCAVNTFASNGKVIINPIASAGPVLAPFKWLTSSDYFMPEYHVGKTFLLLSDAENQQFTDAGTLLTYGEPLETEVFNGWYIYIYDYNLSLDDFLGKPYPMKIKGAALPIAGDGFYEGDHAVLNSGAVQFGPYNNMKAGEYFVTISGENLDRAEIDCIGDSGSIVLPVSEVSRNSTEIVYYISLPVDVGNIEFRTFNNSDVQIRISSIVCDMAEDTPVE